VLGNFSWLADSWAAEDMHDAKGIVTANAGVRQAERCI
jgi:hypothetical protein